MRNRVNIIVAAVAAVGVFGTIGGLMLIGGSDEPPPSSTTALPATTTAAPSTTESPATTVPVTTTPPPAVTLTSTGNQSAPGLLRVVAEFYTWLVDRTAEAPPIPDGLAAHVGSVEIDQVLDLPVEISWSALADGSKVAVALVGNDVVLAVAEEDEWEIVGAGLTGFGLDPWYGDPVRHVLIIGTDARPHESQPELRADSIHILAASMPERGGALVGFPRDAYVTASYGSDKFTSVNVRAGTDEMVRITEDLSGLTMEGYVLTGFAGFKSLVNKLGGVEVDVPFRMSDKDAKAYLDAGLQVLDGGDALAFSRNRHIDGGDFTRSFHQGVVIQAGMRGMQALGIQELPGLLRRLSEQAWTDLSSAQLLQLGAVAYELDPANLTNIVLPGRVGSAGGASVVYLDAAADDIFADLADGLLTTD